MANEFQRFGLIRSEISHEDGLIAHRLSWFLTSQSFLLSGLAIAHRGEMASPAPENNFFFPLIPIIGLLTTVVIFLSIVAGLIALGRWRVIAQRDFPDSVEYPRIPQEGFVNWLGALSPCVLPLIFFVAWILILCWGI